MGKKLTAAGGVLGLGLLGLGLQQSCSGDESGQPETSEPSAMDVAKEKLRAQQAGPLDIDKKEDRERILRALDLNIITDPGAFPEALIEEDALRLKAEDLLGWNNAPGLTLQYIPTTVTKSGEAILGFTLGDKTFVTEGFFDPRQTDALQATALHTLYSCKTTGDCTVYNGPYTPSLPNAVGAQAKSLLAMAEAIAQGSRDLTPKKVTYEGKQNGAHFEGKLTYPNGATLEGVFVKDNGEYRPDGKFKIAWPNGDFFEGTADWDANTIAVGAKGKLEGVEYEFTALVNVKNLSVKVIPDSENELDLVEHKISWEDGTLTSKAVRKDPEGVAMHDVTEAELASYTGYGKYTNFAADSKYSGYEGYWSNGKFGDGKGTLVLKNGQTLQGSFKNDAPAATEDLKFAPKKGDALVTLRRLENKTGWMLWTNEARGEWDKYTWDAVEKTMRIEHMIRP